MSGLCVQRQQITIHLLNSAFQSIEIDGLKVVLGVHGCWRLIEVDVSALGRSQEVSEPFMCVWADACCVLLIDSASALSIDGGEIEDDGIELVVVVEIVRRRLARGRWGFWT